MPPESHRGRPRTFQYRAILPYKTESDHEALEHLNHIVTNLYIALKSDDLKGIVGNTSGPAVTHWTRELRAWTELKFDMPMATRIKLIRVYYSLALAGADGAAMDKFINMFCLLCKDEKFQDTIKPADLDLDWRLLLVILLKLAFPQQSSFDGSVSRSFSAVSRLAQFVRHLIDPAATAAILDEILPHFTVARASISHNVMSLLLLLVPVAPVKGTRPDLLPEDLFPSIFHLWSLVPRSGLYDFQVLDLVSTLVSDSITSELTHFTKDGVLTPDQLSIVFTAILRLLEVPVSYVGSAYASTSETVALKADGDKKVKCARPISNIIVYSLSAELGLEKHGIFDRLESLIHSVETFCHPSNQGPWTRTIMQTVAALVELFLLRWNVQESGESVIPSQRHLTPAVKNRFVRILRNITFLGIHAKSSSVVSSSLDALQGLAYLEPDLILPRVLTEVYPSLQGLVETHRTMSSLKALTTLARKISQEPRYALHLTTLLGLVLPGIDANDLTKTLHSMSFVQAVAVNLPFYDISESVGGSGLAMEYIGVTVAYLEEHGELPEDIIEEDRFIDIARSSTAAFDEFVMVFLGRIFTMLENLPDVSSGKLRDSPEAYVVNSLLPVMTAVFGALPSRLFSRVVDYVVDFMQNNVVHNATDSFAHICGCLVKIDPKVAFGKLFPVLQFNIKYQVEENGAGSSRSGSEVLPRDRALIWYLSALNMSLAHAYSETLNFREEVADIILFLRNKCAGSIFYHISNALHHTLMTLTSTAVVDFRIVPEGEESNPEYIDVKAWGSKLDLNNLKLKWSMPTREQIEFAVELYQQHVDISVKALKEAVNPASDKKHSITELTDVVSSNLTYIRTATSGISLLFDPTYAGSGNEELQEGNSVAMDGDFDFEESESQDTMDDDYKDDDDDFDVSAGSVMSESGMGDDDEAELDGDIVEMKKLREYPINYFFGSGETKQNDVLYTTLHELRLNVGRILHDVHGYLTKERESDIASFKALMFALKVWFCDVGYEKSARTMETLNALYSYETRHFRISGLRKEYPRPVLARRANLYHVERLFHNFGPRKMTDLEKTLLFDIMRSCLSIYPDIRRNGQSSLESAVKVILRSRQLVYPWALKELNVFLQKQDFAGADSAMRLIDLRVLQSSVKRDFKNLVAYVDALKKSMLADYPALNLAASSSYTYIAVNIRLPLNIVSISDSGRDAIEALVSEEQKESCSRRIELMRSRRTDKRQQAELEMKRLVEHLTVANEKPDQHWKVTIVNDSLIAAICSSPQMELSDRVLVQLSRGIMSPFPGVKAVCMHGLFRISSRLLTLATSGYTYERFLLDCDENSIMSPNGVMIDSSKPSFTEEFKAELSSIDSPSYYLDKTNGAYGWLAWPKQFEADKSTYFSSVKLNESDEMAVRALGREMTKEWLQSVIDRNVEEPRSEDDYFEVTNAIYFKIILRLIGLGFTEITLDEFLELLEATYIPDDKNSHRCVAEICSAVIDSLKFTEPSDAEKKTLVLRRIFADVLNNSMAHDNLEYWQSFTWWSSIYIDFRRAWPVEQLINDIRLPVGSTMGFKDSSRLSLIRKTVGSIGWWYTHNIEDILDNLWGNISHGLQAVREEVGRTLATIYYSQFHESFDSVQDFLRANKEAGSIGLLSYELPDHLSKRIVKAFEELEVLRKERLAAVQTDGTAGSQASEYLFAADTLTFFLRTLFDRSYASALIPLLPKSIVPALLNFLNVRDDEELMVNAVSLFKQLGNVPCPLQRIDSMVTMIMEISLGATAWHQRMSILTYIQAFYFRHLFMMSPEQRMQIVDVVMAMLEDVQLEVREVAAETLSGMVRCSPVADQQELIESLQKTCTAMLMETQQWRLLRKNTPGTSRLGTPRSVTPVMSPKVGSLTPTTLSRIGTPVILNELPSVMLRRHSAVLGLGALVKAFPYHSPPPSWVPSVLTTLAVKAAADPGMVGKSVKETLDDFKKTRQDTWHIDSRIFSREQLDDLEGVLWKNYFA